MIDKDTNRLKEGMWICPASMVINGLCCQPREVSKVSGKRIYHWDKHRERQHWMMSSSIEFVCDTKEEAEKMFRLERDRRKAADDLKQTYRKMAEDIVADSLMKKL
jgi:hypothetical protein